MDTDRHAAIANRRGRNAACGIESGRRLFHTLPSACRIFRAPILALGLMLATAWVFWPVLRCGFLTFDDPEYVTDNPMVQQGLQADTVRWAFRTGHQANWHPVTWLSHALDCQLYGLRPAGHHATSLTLHAANAALLFLFLFRSTGATWRAAFVAALFAWHPLRVESVAWVAERKDVLSGFFFFLTLIAYMEYVVRPKAHGQGQGSPKTSGSPGRLSPKSSPPHPAPHSALWYYAALVCFAFGLMSKPMLVTLPFVLLLLDIWPLARLQIRNQKSEIRNLIHMLVEKVPFFALAVVSCIITYAVQSAGYAVKDRPLAERFANAAMAYVSYLRQTFWPTDFAVFYPHPQSLSMGAAAGATALLVILTALVFVQSSNSGIGGPGLMGRRRGALLVGWLWFLGMLVPVIGFIQVGAQARADRYTYLPSIGIFVMIAWGLGRADVKGRKPEAPEVSSRSLTRSPAFPAIALSAALVALLPLTRAYLAYWASSESLFTHALKVTGPNPIALNHVGVALVMEDRFAEAKPYFEQAIALDPKNTQAPFNLATVLLKNGKVDEALELLQPALKGKPVISKGFAGMGLILASLGRPADAIRFYAKALEADPHAVEPLNNLAWLFATAAEDNLRNGEEAVRLAEHACGLTAFRRPVFVGTLAAAYAESGRFSDAIATAERARDLARAQGDSAIADRNEELLRLYRAGKPFREEATGLQDRKPVR